MENPRCCAVSTILFPQFYEGNLKGFCRIQGRDTGELSVGEVGRLAASVFQDPRSQFFTINSTTEVAFGMENHGVPREEMVEKVEAAFGLFSLEKLKDRNVYELSSGERQLISTFPHGRWIRMSCCWMSRRQIWILLQSSSSANCC